MSKALDPKDTCVLVTGGAGFIGSHTVVQLLEGGYQVVIVDDLSNSSAVAVDRVKTIVGDEAAKNLTFYKANVLDRDAMNKAAGKMLEHLRKQGNTRVTHDEVKRRMIEAVKRKGGQ